MIGCSDADACADLCIFPRAGQADDVMATWFEGADVREQESTPYNVFRPSTLHADVPTFISLAWKSDGSSFSRSIARIRFGAD